MGNRSGLDGHRTFTWVKPQKQRPSEYELLTVGQQSSPERWLHVDWPVRFEDGRPPFTAESTALRCGRWEDYRDPAQLWQRPYVARLNREEQALDTFSRELLAGGLAQGMNSVWRAEVLGRYLAAWPFVEHGLCMALCYAVRQALADTLTFQFVFQAADKMRHGQDIVHLLFDLHETFPDFSDAAARPAWMTDPALLPLRENVERIWAAEDWAELAFAATLVLEPLVGELFRTELISRNASSNGDPVSSMVLAGARRDARRHLESTAALVRFVGADPDHGTTNRVILQGWLQRWLPLSMRAAEALRPVFTLDGIHVEPFESCLQRVRAQYEAVLRELGLEPGEGV